MFGLIPRHTHEQALTLAHAENSRLEQLLDTARKELADAREAAKPADPMQKVIAAARARTADEHEARPLDGAPATPLPLATQLRRAKDHATALARQLDTVTAANQHCTCGGTR
ncbi:hypothetical protein ACFYRN_45310 [Streptomyces sp. NPDC005227]|uniref:hypothetical protein n=1 Tax=Streptomyces sp. NPDC005227 TaxID=3364707 RepID=UPI0036AB599F